MAPRRWRSRAAAALSLFTGKDGPVEAMHALVDSLLASAGLDCPPADVEMLASLRGVRRVERVDMAEAGRLIPEGAGYVIQVNSRHPETRQRFTVAHEVGHTFVNEACSVLKSVFDRATSLYDDHDEEEYLCDVAGGRTLLHPLWLRPAVEAERPSLQALLSLADCCRASIEATAIQVAQLALWRCSFVFWEPGLRKEEQARLGQSRLAGLGPNTLPTQRLRARRVYAGPDVPFLPLNKSAAEDSHVWRAYAEQTQTEGEDVLDIGNGMVARAYTQSIYAPYFDETGSPRPRVVSCIIWSQAAAQRGRRSRR